MSLKCGDIIDILERFAPSCLAEGWDNVGLIVGSRQANIKKILVALDATMDVVDEAVAIGAELIITHHPVIFKPIPKISDDTPLGRKLLKIIQNGICIYSMHTNLDIAPGGTNDELARILGVENTGAMFITDDGVSAIGRKGVLSEPMSLGQFAEHVKDRLGLSSIRFVGEADCVIKTVGISTGSASNSKNFAEAKAAMCDAFITGDIRFHEAQEALTIGLCLIDATHYASENIIVGKIAEIVGSKLKECGINISIIPSAVDGQVFKNI